MLKDFSRVPKVGHRRACARACVFPAFPTAWPPVEEALPLHRPLPPTSEVLHPMSVANQDHQRVK